MNCNPQPALHVYGDPINHVSDFRYLLSMVASGSSDLKRRKSLAWCAFWKLEQLWKSPHISITIKVKLFNTTCVTILLYGCESWVISLSKYLPPQAAILDSLSFRRGHPGFRTSFNFFFENGMRRYKITNLSGDHDDL